MKILGVDPGTIKTGWGIVEYEGGEFPWCMWGTASAPQEWRRPLRLYTIFQELTRVVEEWEPDVIAVETPFVGRNPQTAIAIGQALAVVLLVAEAHHTRLSYYSPAEVKRAATSYGRSDKGQVGRFVMAMLGIDLAKTGRVDDNATDALAVAICHANRRDEAAILQRVDRP